MVPRGNQVREQASVKMVHLVLQAARQEPVAFDGHGASVHQGQDSLHAGAAQDVRIHLGDAQATFPVRHIPAEGVQDGIDEIQWHDLRQRGRASVHFQPCSSGVRGRNIDGDHLNGSSHLRSGQAYAPLGQGFLHVVQEGKKVFVDVNHGAAFLPQKGVSVLKNVKNHGG